MKETFEYRARARDALVRAAAALTVWPNDGTATPSDTILALALQETLVGLLFITKMDHAEHAKDLVIASLDRVRAERRTTIAETDWTSG
jgi:hypothetical protein